MRILAQEGINEKWDIPYEIAVVSYSKYMEGRYRIYAQGTFAGMNPNENSIQIAEYSTESKAKRAMEMLHNEYHGYKVEEVYHEGTEYYHPIFQFPADEELEV